MEELYHLVEGKQLIVRKRMGSFIEKMLRYCGYGFSHDRFKQIIYAEGGYQTPLEEKIKNFYDGFNYLLNNYQSPITQSLLKRFHYIVFEEEMDSFLALKLVTKYFIISDLSPIEQAIEFHMAIYQELKGYEENDKMILSLMLLNYILVKHGIPCIHILYTDLKEYEICRRDFLNSNKAKMLEFLLKVLKKNKYLDKKFYKNLTPLDKGTIVKTILEQEAMLRDRFKIKGIWLYGSFAKRLERLDSDIDLFVSLSLDLMVEERKTIIRLLTDYLEEIFHRFVDIHEVFEYVPDEMIKEAIKIKRIL